MMIRRDQEFIKKIFVKKIVNIFAADLRIPRSTTLAGGRPGQELWGRNQSEKYQANIKQKYQTNIKQKYQTNIKQKYQPTKPNIKILEV